MAEETVIEAESIETPSDFDFIETAEDVLALYQMRLRVPKDQRNDFGKYQYRSMEDINDAFHRVQIEIWEQYGILTSLHFSEDSLLKTQDGSLRRFVLAVLHTPFGDIRTEMSVREPESQGGMNPSQISGSASSYAKKYAASDLFALGGEADPDELPPALVDAYPSGRFDAKCRHCGEVRHGFNADTARSWPCPSCGAIDWEPVS